MDEKTAWSSFAHSGSVADYLLYAQCKAHTGQEEKPDAAHRDRGNGDPRGECGRK